MNNKCCCDLLSNSVLTIFDNNLMDMVIQEQGCDLLSNSVLTIFDNNFILNFQLNGVVVICFQIQFLRSLITTGANRKQ